MKVARAKVDEYTEVPKSSNPYVKLLVRLYKFLARKYRPGKKAHASWAGIGGLTATQAAPMRPSTRLSSAVL